MGEKTRGLGHRNEQDPLKMMLPVQNYSGCNLESQAFRVLFTSAMKNVFQLPNNVRIVVNFPSVTPTLSPKLLCIQKSVTFSNRCASPPKLEMERGSSFIYFKLE